MINNLCWMSTPLKLYLTNEFLISNNSNMVLWNCLWQQLASKNCRLSCVGFPCTGSHLLTFVSCNWALMMPPIPVCIECIGSDSACQRCAAEEQKKRLGAASWTSWYDFVCLFAFYKQYRQTKGFGYLSPKTLHRVFASTQWARLAVYACSL